MKRQFNFRFFAVMLVFLGVLGLAGHQIQKYHVRKNASYLLHRGMEAVAQKEYETATRYFTHYLTLNPRDSLARARLGVFQASQAANAKDLESAYLILEQALRDDPQLEQKAAADPEIAAERNNPDPELAAQAKDLGDIRRTTVRLAMKLRLYNDAVSHIQKMLEKLPNDAELLVLRGVCEESANRDDRAVLDFTKAIENDPKLIEAYSRKASLLHRKKEPHLADKVIGDMLLANATVPAFLLATDYYQLHEQLASARAQLDSARKLETDNAEVLLATVRVANGEGKPSEAEAALRRGLEKYPDRHEFRIGAASQALATGQKEQAIELLRKAEAAIVKPSLELWTVADLFIDAAAWADAEKVLIRLRKAKADTEAIEYLEARIHLVKGAIREAQELFLRCERVFPKNSDLGLRTQILLADCYNQSGKPDLQLKAARKAVEMNGTSVPARLALAAALLASGMRQDALEEYRFTLGRDPRMRAYVARLVLSETIRKPLAEQSFEAPMKLLTDAPPELRQTTDFVLADAEVLLFDGAVMTTRGKATIPAGSKEPTAGGKKLIADGGVKLAEAKKRVEQARDANPKELRYWLFLAERAAAEGKPTDGLAILDRAREAVGDGVEMRLARAIMLRSAADDVRSLVALESDVGQFSQNDQSKLFVGLAEIHERIGSAGHSERLLQLAHQLQPRNLKILARLLDVVGARERAEEVGVLVQPIREAEGDDGALWRFAAAFQLWLSHLNTPNDKNVETARMLLAAARESRPKWFRIPLLEGEIADRMGPADLALEKYKSAFQLGANNPQFVARLTYLLVGRNRHEEVEQTTREYRRRTARSSEELDRIDVYNRLMRGSDPEDVASVIKIPKDSKRVEDQLFRGRMYSSLRDRAIASELKARLTGADSEAAEWRQKAEEWTKSAEHGFRSGVELAPTTPQVWVSLVRFLVTLERSEDAKQEVARAEATVPADKKHQTLGPCYEAVGDREKARQHYEAAGSDTTSQRALATFYLASGDSSKAAEVLRILTTAAGDPATVRWARRTLALSLLSTRTESYAKNLEAEGLIKANLSEERGSLEDDRVLAFIYAFRPGGRSESIQKLEALFLRMSPSAPEQFMLARLYELDGNWSAANERYLNLFARPGGDDRAYLVPYIQSLLRRKDARSAEFWVNRLEKKEKGTFALVEIKARLHCLQGMNTDASDGLKTFAAKVFETQKNPAVLAAVAAVLADLDLIADAETMYRQYVMAAESKLPAAGLVLAEFLAQYRDQTTQALEICSTLLSKKVEPEVIARVAVAVVRLGDHATSANQAEAERIIQAAAATKPQSLDISISLADLRDAQGRYQEAKSIYRSVLSRNRRASLAMNNLAWLLALEEKKPTEALTLIDEAISIHYGPEGNLLDTRGVILLAAGNSQEAISTLTRAVNDEHTPERHFHLAQAFLKRGKTKEAGLEMRKARELGLEKKVKFLHRLELPEYERLNRTLTDDD